jgi:hypothetical protein
MRTIFTITGRKFTTLEFAKKFADKNNIDYSLISEKQIEEYVAPKNVFIGKESQEKYNERRARIAQVV